MLKPWNKITVPKKTLKNLYEKQGFPIAQIALKLGYSTTPIHRLLRLYQIKIRNISEAKEKIKITKKELKNLYWQQKLSAEQIAQKYGCSHATIVNRMKKYKIKSRGNLGLTRPIRISREKLKYLYHRRGLSLAKIAKILHCSEGGLERKIKNLKINTRPISQRACKYKKKEFNGDLIERAYMLGFRLGDLNVYQSKNVIIIRCSTTKRAQVTLIKNLFCPYGGINITKAKRGTYEISGFLNQSFNFLIPKEDKIPVWIINDNLCFWAFFAGYCDAEGSLQIHAPRDKHYIGFAIFSLSSYEKQTLFQIWDRFQASNIQCPLPFLKSPKGTPCGNKKYLSNNDAWCLTVARKNALWRLVHFWEKYSKHNDKKKVIREARKNLILRNQLPYCHKIDLSVPKMP